MKPVFLFSYKDADYPLEHGVSGEDVLAHGVTTRLEGHQSYEIEIFAEALLLFMKATGHNVEAITFKQAGDHVYTVE